MSKLQNNCDLVPTTPSADLITAGASTLWTPEALVLVQSQVVTASATVSFLNLGNYPYTNYKLIISNVQNSGNAAITLTLSVNNNGSSPITSGYQGGAPLLPYNSSTITAHSSAAGFPIITTSLGGAGTTYAVNMDLYNINLATRFVCVGGYCVSCPTSANYFLLTGIYPTLITAKAILISADTGTITGNFYLYAYNG